MVYTPRKLNSQELNVMRDIKASPILATALMENIDIFIAGDKDFHVLDIENPEILTISVSSQQTPHCIPQLHISRLSA